MSEMRFENQGDEFGAPPTQSRGFDLAGSLVRAGLVSSEQEAYYVLIGIALLALVVAGYFFFHSFGGGTAPPPPPHMAPTGTY